MPLNNLKKVAFIVLAAATTVSFAASVTDAQSPASTQGLLYKISGNGLKKPSYLFGTTHVICPDDMFSMAGLGSRLSETDRLILEIDMDDEAEIQSVVGALTASDGKTIKDYLSDEQYAKVDEMFRDILGLPLNKFAAYKPFMLGALVSMSPKITGCARPVSYDQTLLQFAKAVKKPVEGLETANEQIALLEAETPQKQAELLYEMALSPQKTADDMKALTAAYKTQDPEALYQVVNLQMAKHRPMQVRFLDERNTKWIPRIARAIREKPSFIAVGGGHLGGKKGVVSLLRSMGYKLEAIRL